MLLQVNESVRGDKAEFNVPASKPETQRAILIGALAEGKSKVYNDLRCVETATMIAACRAIGAKITEYGDHLEIVGVGGVMNYDNSVIDCKGSGLVFRTFTALTSVCQSPVVLSGDNTLRRRVMEPLFAALRQLGVTLDCIAEESHAPVVNWSRSIEGGTVTLPGDISSQFITAIMLVAPLANGPIEINVEGTVYSLSYLRQTVIAMEAAGIKVTTDDTLNYIRIEPGKYQAVDTVVGADYTSASYLFAYAALNKGTTTLKNIQEKSNQGERAIVDIVRELGLEIIFDDENRVCTINNPEGSMKGDFEFNAVDFPNIVPTLAAIGSYVDGTFRVKGGSITRLHKAPRAKAMTTELAKLGVDIKEVFDGEKVDGFEIKGAQSYSKGEYLSSWGDHRIFMSLFLASLRVKDTCYLSGHRDVDCSFPDFLEQFSNNSVDATEVVQENTDIAA